jgi:hypothetical protein
MSVAGGRATTKDDLATAVALQLTRRMTFDRVRTSFDSGHEINQLAQ